MGLEFKKISAVNHFIWAIGTSGTWIHVCAASNVIVIVSGGDRQVYVHVHGLDVPIRIKEEVYENERWYPIEGNFKN